jgi:hypothetical protein
MTDSTDISDDLNKALAVPSVITLSGLTLHLKLLTIVQLPKARELAAQLFSDPALNFTDSGFILDIEDRHIALMADLMELMVDSPTKLLAFPIADFLELFNKVIAFNDDFFLAVIGRSMLTRQQTVTDGPTSSSALEVTDISTQSG